MGPRIESTLDWFVRVLPIRRRTDPKTQKTNQTQPQNRPFAPSSPQSPPPPFPENQSSKNRVEIVPTTPNSRPRNLNLSQMGQMGKDLSSDQVASMREAFTLFDTDGDGKIAPSELGILMRSLGGNPTQAQLKSIVAEERLVAAFDFDRFMELMARHMKAEPFDRQLRDAFRVIDKEGSGFVNVSDLRHILTSIGEKLEASEFDEWIKEVDVGSDGRIRYEEFIERMVAK